MDEFEKLKYDGDCVLMDITRHINSKIVKQLESTFGNMNLVNLMNM